MNTEILEGEEFRSVIGYDGLYSVSNLGRVMSERRERPNGGYLKERILKISITQNGQCSVGLSENNKRKRFLISTLVADAFIPKDRDGKTIVVIHKNKNPKDNRLVNLIVDSKSVSNKIDYLMGITAHNIDSMALMAVERGKEREHKFGIYDAGVLVGYVCTRCFNNCDLTDFRHTNTICNNCKSISEGVYDIGKIKRRKELSIAGLQECSRCKNTKPFIDFHKSKYTKNGIVSKCKGCYQQHHKAKPKQ